MSLGVGACGSDFESTRGTGGVEPDPAGAHILSTVTEARCTLDTTYRYGVIGGLVRYNEKVTLSPPASYVYTRTPIGTDDSSLSCAPALPPCHSPGALDVTDILRAIAHPDVQRALAAPSPRMYGRDTRPADGTIFEFLRADGRGFLVGDPCDSVEPQCRPIPAGLARLVSDLRALDRQQLRDPACAELRRRR